MKDGLIGGKLPEESGEFLGLMIIYFEAKSMGDQSLEREFRIMEQTIDDSEVSGLILKFESCRLGEYKLTIEGDFPHGNRTVFFNTAGEFTGAGIAIKKAGCY